MQFPTGSYPKRNERKFSVPAFPAAWLYFYKEWRLYAVPLKYQAATFHAQELCAQRRRLRPEKRTHETGASNGDSFPPCAHSPLTNRQSINLIFIDILLEKRRIVQSENMRGRQQLVDCFAAGQFTFLAVITLAKRTCLLRRE